MNTWSRTLWLSVLGLGVCLSNGNGVHAQQPPPPPTPDPASSTAAADDTALQGQGVEVQTRGPVNEAFAEPDIRGPRPSPIVTKQPPDPITELPPDQRPDGENVEWIPGYWAWDDDRQDFLWVSGAWRAVPPGREWIPGYWAQVQGGWQWVAGYWQDQSQAVTLLPEPPDPIQEAVPPAPTQTDVWVPGCWVYNQTQYSWRPGFWTAFQPNWVWSPANYIWTPGGYIFVDGHWDYPLQTRGLLFAPIVFTSPVYRQPNWVYRPAFAVYDQSLLDSLFIRLANHHYYFGDYFEPKYQKLGFRDWYDYSVTRRYHDPLFAYYRVAHRDNPGWERSLRDTYVTRRDNPAARPPRTLIQQTKIVNNIHNTKEVNRLAMVAPLNRYRQTTQVKLRPVTQTRLTETRKTVQQFHELSRQRAEATRQVVARGTTVSRPGERAAPVKLNLNRVQTTAIRSVAVKAPERPKHPQLENRPVPRVENRPVGRPGAVRPGEERRPAARPGENRPPEARQPATRPEERRPGGVAPESRPMPRPGEERRPASPPGERRPGATPQPRPEPRPGAAPEKRPEPNRPGEAHRPAVNPEPRPTPKPAENRPVQHRPTPAAEPRPMQPGHPAPAPQQRPAPAAEHRPTPTQPAEKPRPPAQAQPRPAPAKPPAAQHQPGPPAQSPAARPSQPERRPTPPPQAEHRPAPAPAARPPEKRPQPPPQAEHRAPPPSHPTPQPQAARPAPPPAHQPPPQAEHRPAAPPPNHPMPQPQAARPAPPTHQPAPPSKPASNKEPHDKRHPDK